MTNSQSFVYIIYPFIPMYKNMYLFLNVYLIMEKAV